MSRIVATPERPVRCPSPPSFELTPLGYHSVAAIRMHGRAAVHAPCPSQADVGGSRHDRRTGSGMASNPSSKCDEVTTVTVALGKALANPEHVPAGRFASAAAAR